MDATDNACVLAGMAALGVIMYSRTVSYPMYGPSLYGSNPTECSAMKADTSSSVSAKAAATEEPLPTETTDFWGGLFAGEKSEGFEKQFADSKVAPGGGMYSETVQKAINDIRPTYTSIETTYASELGAIVPVAGRALDASKPKHVKATGACLFNQTAAYANALEENGL